MVVSDIAGICGMVDCLLTCAGLRLWRRSRWCRRRDDLGGHGARDGDIRYQDTLAMISIMEWFSLILLNDILVEKI